MLLICAVNIIKIKVDKKDKLLFCFFVVWGFLCFVFGVFIWFYFVWLSFFIFLEKDTRILDIKLGVIRLRLEIFVMDLPVPLVQHRHNVLHEICLVRWISRQRSSAHIPP